MLQRCTWCGDDSLYVSYHDQEWGVPVYDDQKQFEFLILEGMQAGLSWITILRKRENFREAFNQFNPEKIARYDEKKFQELMLNPGIIRNRQKILATINNAKVFLRIQEHQSFAEYIWQFTEGKVIHNKWQTSQKIPANTALSDKMAKELKKQGFSFVGTTVCYSHMQATGMVNDHLVSCFRYGELK